jgi:predicted PolB exonuclease-like 3'-5' exonuclease
VTPILVFDIETIPDVEGLRRLWDLGPEVSEQGVVDLVSQRRRQATGNDFLPHYLQRVVAISCVLRSNDGLRVWSLGGAQDGEREIVQRFFDGIEKYTPQLVSWNGSGFDLPVLHYRGLRHGVVASKYWDLGDDDREYRYNNYISRYHLRHLDLMDLLAMYQPKANAPLDAMARLCGFAGKLGMDGSQVFGAYKEGRLDEIRRYCETDVMNTYLLYCRFQQMRGGFSDVEYRRELAGVREMLAGMDEPHWREYLRAWPEDATPAEAPAAAPAQSDP